MLRGELVNLRAVERDDAVCIHRWYNTPEVMLGWAFPAAVMSMAEIQRRVEVWIDAEGRLPDRPAAFLIETLEGDPVGLVVTSQYEPVHRSVELSLVIGERDRWSEGLGSDALRTICAACFDYWRIHRIVLRSEASNERAHRLYERLGFTLEATLREASWVDSRFEDVYVFSLLSTDPAAIDPQ